MATLEKIRKRGKLIAFLIGFALLAFIVGDLFNSGTSIFGSSKTNIAVVNGKTIDYNEYENFVIGTEEYVKLVQGLSNLDEQTTVNIRSSAWDLLIREKLLSDTYKKHGFEISAEELQDLTIGNNVHPLIMQTFVDPNTGVYDKNIVVNVVQNLDKDPQLKSLWIYIEDYIKKDRIYTKYQTLVSKGLFVNKLEVEYDNTERKRLANVDIVAKTVFEIPDSTITVSDEEIQKYYDEHKNMFQNYEETRDIAYILFSVTPLKEDTTAAFQLADKTKNQIKDATDAADIYTEGTKTVKYFSKSELESLKLDTIINKMNVGEVYGPVLMYNSYFVYKVLEFMERPDSVSARHILISPSNPKIGTIERAQVVADSLVNVLKNGGDFALLAALYSDDPGSKDKGGLYENFTDGQMVTEFNDYCFTKNIGEVGTVKTQYGVHIIEVTARKNVIRKPKLLALQFNITPSENTFNYFYSQSSLARGEINTAADFDKVADKYKVVIREANDITKGTYSIPGLQSIREIVRWSFNAEQNEVSQVFQQPDSYIIAVVRHKNDIGYLPIDKVKQQIENTVRSEKKVEKLYTDYFAKANTSNLDNLATTLNVQKQSVPNVSFNAFQLASFGYEPAVLAAIFNAKQPGIIGTIKGINGVYVLQITSFTEATPMTADEFKQQQLRLTQALQSRAGYQAYTSLKATAEIQDRRTNFF